ncbi:fibronectin type III domain-containing protein, partial [Kineococcus glutinatus]|uniref:fibronectin type III domain-containing protein n=1 Tax=Kineococcus glutinatus TaxID=1070872 RepID=UPI0031EA1B41
TSATVTGLDNGTAYAFDVVATNRVGTGAASPLSVPVTPAAVPGAATGVSATAGNASLTATWTAPADTGGSPVTAYTVRAHRAGSSTATTVTVGGSSTTATLTGLVNGSAYTVDVVATNAVGAGPASARSAAVTPVAATTVTVPGAPTTGGVVLGDRSATVSWKAPAGTGGAAITGYVVRRYDGTTGALQATTTVAATARSHTATGLTAGRRYAFTVAAVNRAGTGAASARSAVVTAGAVPPAPRIATATSGTPGGAVTATAAWNPPTGTSTPAVTGYRVIAQRVNLRGDVVQTITSAVQPATGRTLRMTLPAGRYRFSVVAVNAIGTSAASRTSNTVLAL